MDIFSPYQITSNNICIAYSSLRNDFLSIKSKMQKYTHFSRVIIKVQRNLWEELLHHIITPSVSMATDAHGKGRKRRNERKKTSKTTTLNMWLLWNNFTNTLLVNWTWLAFVSTKIHFYAKIVTYVSEGCSRNNFLKSFKNQLHTIVIFSGIAVVVRALN